MDDLVQQVVDLFRNAIAAAGLSWDTAVIPFEIGGGSVAAGVAYISAGSDRSSVLLDIPRSAELASALCSALSESTGVPVRRVRVNVESDWSTSVDHFGPRPNPHDMNIDFGVWPDEEGYAGRVYVSPPIERMDSWEFESVSGAIGEPADSLMRAGEWLSANVPELAALLNPGSSEEALVDFEDRLGVVLPRSVREAWLVHDGQSGNHGALRYIWLSLEASAEQLRWFGDRPDGGVGMIPILKIDGHVAYVESVASGESDGPVWLWEVRGNRDMRLADSFGEYLAWFAGACAAGEIVVSESGLLNRRDEIYPTVE